MKNLKKHTKAELISKINGLKTNPGLFSKTMSFLLLFKSFILKITLIAIVIKIFKRYSILRRLWTVFNTILVTIFGISLVDTFHLEILSNLFHNIIDVFTKFQTNLLELFGHKIETPTKMGTMNRNDSSSTKIQNEVEGKSKIIERFNKIIHNEPEEIKEDTPIYKNKYVIIGGILILSGLTWYFYDDLKPIGSSILAWINSSRPKPGGDSSNSRYDFNPNSPWNISKPLKDWWNKGESDDGFISPPTPSPTYKPLKLIKDWWNKDKSAEVEPGTNSPITMGKGKAIDPRELSEKEVERRLWNQISGDRQQNFDWESQLLLGEITNFNDKVDSISDLNLRAVIYSTIRGKLLTLSALSPFLYANLIKDNKINNEIDRFIDLETRITTEDTVENQSDTYNEVALATVEEQEVWSDKALSPRAPLSPIIHPITDKPKSGFASLLDQINSFRNDKDVVDENVPENKQEQTDLDDENILDKVKEVFKEDIGLKLDTHQSPIVEVPQPDIIVNSGSDDSMDHYFPKSELIQEVVNQPEDSINVKTKLDNFKEDAEAFYQKSAFQNIRESINSMTADKDITSTPNVGNVGLQTPIQDRLKLSPLMPKPSLSNLFEDTMNLFDDGPIDTGIDTSGESSNKVDVQPPITRPSLPSSLLDQIKSKRLEYGSPTSDSHKDLLIEDHKPADETYSSEDDLDPWKEVKVNIKTGGVHNRYVDIDFGEVRDKVAKILIYTNDGESNYFNPNLDGKKQSQSFKWDNKGINNHYYKDLEIHKIFIIEKGSTHSKEIYNNPDVKFLPHYLESLRK
jgi:hypothetical protein